jgi:aminoglycoside phosphotransferase (APT) family kinase protein
VHGDYRIDNLLFEPLQPQVVAVLDWELSTLGHPLADFSYHCMAWHIEPGVFKGMGGIDIQALGLPSEHEYMALYCQHTGFSQPKQLQREWNFYLAYNLFRLAAILQGIAKRLEAGIASSDQAHHYAAAARPLADTLAERDERARRARWEEMTGEKWPEQSTQAQRGDFIDIQATDVRRLA